MGKGIYYAHSNHILVDTDSLGHSSALKELFESLEGLPTNEQALKIAESCIEGISHLNSSECVTDAINEISTNEVDSTLDLDEFFDLSVKHLGDDLFKNMQEKILNIAKEKYPEGFTESNGKRIELKGDSINELCRITFQSELFEYDICIGTLFDDDVCGFVVYLDLGIELESVIEQKDFIDATTNKLGDFDFINHLTDTTSNFDCDISTIASNSAGVFTYWSEEIIKELFLGDMGTMMNLHDMFTAEDGRLVYGGVTYDLSSTPEAIEKTISQSYKSSCIAAHQRLIAIANEHYTKFDLFTKSLFNELIQGSKEDVFFRAQKGNGWLAQFFTHKSLYTKK